MQGRFVKIASKKQGDEAGRMTMSAPRRKDLPGLSGSDGGRFCLRLITRNAMSAATDHTPSSARPTGMLR